MNALSNTPCKLIFLQSKHNRINRIYFSYFVLRRGKIYCVCSLIMNAVWSSKVKWRGEHLLCTFTHELQTLLLVLNIHLGITQASHVDLVYSMYTWDDVVNDYILRITCLRVKSLNSLQTWVPQWMVAPVLENFYFSSK